MIDPTKLTHFLAMLACLTLDEQSTMRGLIAELSTVEFDYLIEEMAELSIPDAVKTTRRLWLQPLNVAIDSN